MNPWKLAAHLDAQRPVGERQLDPQPVHAVDDEDVDLTGQLELPPPPPALVAAPRPKAEPRSWLEPPTPREPLPDGWGCIDDDLLMDPKVSDGAKLTYLAVQRHCPSKPRPGWPIGQCTISLAQIAADRGISDRWARKHIAELRAVGRIRTTQVGRRRLRFYLPRYASWALQYRGPL